MSRNSPLYQQVYDSLASQIYSGELFFGAHLPSIADLSEAYDVSPITVRSSLHHLCEAGLVDTRRGREAVVVFRGMLYPTHGDPAAAEWLLERCVAVSEVFGMFELLLPQIIAFCLSVPDPALAADLRKIYAAAKRFPGNIRAVLKSLFQFLLRILRNADNPILFSLFSKIGEFFYTPLLLVSADSDSQRQTVATVLHRMEFLLHCAEQNDSAGLPDYVRKSYAAAGARFQRLSDRFSACGDVRKSRPFRWAISPEYEFRYGAVAGDLCLRIVCGDFPDGELLPPESALCKRYDVSAVTLRRSLKYLSQLGFTHTHNGIGTVPTACPPTSQIRQDAADSWESKLLNCAATLQFLALTLPAIVPATLSVVSSDDLATLQSKIRNAKSFPGTGYMCTPIISADFVISHCPNTTVRLVCSQFLSHLCLCGCFRGDIRPGYSDYYRQSIDLLQQAEVLFGRRDASALAENIFRQLRLKYDYLLEIAAENRLTLNLPFPDRQC